MPSLSTFSSSFRGSQHGKREYTETRILVVRRRRTSEILPSSVLLILPSFTSFPLQYVCIACINSKCTSFLVASIGIWNSSFSYLLCISFVFFSELSALCDSVWIFFVLVKFGDRVLSRCEIRAVHQAHEYFLSQSVKSGPLIRAHCGGGQRP